MQTSRYNKQQQQTQAVASLERHTGATGGVAGAESRALPGVRVAALQRTRLLQLALGCGTAESTACTGGYALGKSNVCIRRLLQAAGYLLRGDRYQQGAAATAAS